MRFGLDVATNGAWSDVRVLADLAADAEAAGWDGFFVWDILLAEANAAEPVADPWVALAAIALRTERIVIGAMVTPLARRRPWDVARQVATLDRLSGGRMVLGGGLGWLDDDFARFGEDADPRARAERLDEALAVIELLWRGEPVHHDGAHYRLAGPVLLPTPVQLPRPPVWLAAGWPRRRPLARATRWDGVYLQTEHAIEHRALTAADVADAVTAVREQRGSADGFQVGVNFVLDEPVDVAALEASGATWLIGLTPDTVEAHRKLIRRGPPGGRPAPGRVRP
jgi:alkanesulfonate monooxygenase SsuD/methylene tetrahydromethanopterin reductase-like flavin-dependent oxidoreductase (luciferase family)